MAADRREAQDSDAGGGREAFAALCRTLEARTGLGAIAVFAAEPGGWRLCFATEGYRALCREDPVGPPQDMVSNRPGPVRVPPAVLGLAAAAALVQAAPGGGDMPAGVLVVASRRVRRGGTRLTAALRDAAEIAGLIMTGSEAPLRRRLPLEGTPGGSPAGSGALIPPRQPAASDAPRQPPPRAKASLLPRQPEAARGAVLSRTAAHQLLASLLRARSRGEPLAFVLLDIDRFRSINEALGDRTGDAALEATQSALAACLGSEDRLIRLEGDRFLVVASPARRDVRDLAESLLAAVRRLDLPGRRLAMQASAGIVLAGRAEASPVRLLMQADSAVRRAKAQGGDRVEIHEPGLHAALLDRARLELDLRHALENGELSLVYQPYVSLATGEMTGLEALLRWRHPQRGEIAPTTFIPLAEATGLILPIGMWAVRTACRAAALWPGSLTLSVNVSPLQFQVPGFAGQIEAALAETGLPPERLEIEITETVLMRDNPETIGQLKALIARGIRIALDDFGTGYSALAYLSRLPHHRIKLDKSFVQDLGCPSTAALIRAIIALAKGGGIETTAEGVEHPDQLPLVATLGFTHAQGFATGLPVEDPAALCRALLKP